MRRLMLAPLLALVFVVCTPTEPCGCTPATTQALVLGRITTAVGAPAAGLRVEAEVYDRGCGEAGAYPTNIGQRAAVTDGDGRYRIAARSFVGEQPMACATVAVIRGADTVQGGSTNVALRRGPPLDSARVDIALP